jgi:hypothetical protein
MIPYIVKSPEDVDDLGKLQNPPQTSKNIPKLVFEVSGGSSVALNRFHISSRALIMFVILRERSDRQDPSCTKLRGPSRRCRRQLLRVTKTKPERITTLLEAAREIELKEIRDHGYRHQKGQQYNE